MLHFVVVLLVVLLGGILQEFFLLTHWFCDLRLVIVHLSARDQHWSPGFWLRHPDQAA